MTDSRQHIDLDQGHTPHTEGDDMVDAVRELRGRLETGRSASQILEQWCETRGLGKASPLLAEKIAEGGFLCDADLAIALRIEPMEPLGFRHVRLYRGAHILSEACLWFVPARLPAATVKTLSTSDLPFGKVIESLDFDRRLIEARSCREPGDAFPSSMACLFTLRAILSFPDGTPFAYVHEAYLRGLLGQE